MRKVILITGGQRSGKSTFAEKMALSLCKNPVYLATSRIWDEEFRERIRQHQLRRGPEWTNIEEEKYPSRLSLQGRVVLIDCITLWCTNFFFDNREDMEKTYTEITQEFDRIVAMDSTFIFVTNEIGSGGVHVDNMQRHFTDLLGKVNQYVAAKADDVYLMISGIHVKIK